jgi:hypothetical protein
MNKNTVMITTALFLAACGGQMIASLFPQDQLGRFINFANTTAPETTSTNAIFPVSDAMPSPDYAGAAFPSYPGRAFPAYARGIPVAYRAHQSLASPANNNLALASRLMFAANSQADSMNTSGDAGNQSLAEESPEPNAQPAN